MTGVRLRGLAVGWVLPLLGGASIGDLVVRYGWWGVLTAIVVAGLGVAGALVWHWQRWWYIDTRDWWIGYYRGPDYHYVCLLPCVVIRWRRR